LNFLFLIDKYGFDKLQNNLSNLKFEIPFKAHFYLTKILNNFDIFDLSDNLNYMDFLEIKKNLKWITKNLIYFNDSIEKNNIFNFELLKSNL
jgi:hypothetical protein